MERNPVTPRRLTEGGGRGRRKEKKKMKKKNKKPPPSDSIGLVLAGKLFQRRGS